MGVRVCVPACAGVMGEGVLLAQQLLHPDFIESQRHRDPFLDFLRQFRIRDHVTKQPWQVLLHIWMRSHFPVSRPFPFKTV
jgi:hypothetical protein